MGGRDSYVSVFSIARFNSLPLRYAVDAMKSSNTRRRSDNDSDTFAATRAGHFPRDARSLLQQMVELCIAGWDWRRVLTDFVLDSSQSGSQK
jgi:hypothetical protein